MDRPARDAIDDLVEHVAVSGCTDATHVSELGAKSLAYRLRRVAHLLELEMRRELAGHGVDLGELELLAALLRAPGERLSAGELTVVIAVTAGTATHRVSRVEERGWVRRDLDPADRRSVIVSLTDAGRQRALEVLQVKTEVEKDVLGVLDAQTLDIMNDGLRDVGHQLGTRSKLAKKKS